MNGYQSDGDKFMGLPENLRRCLWWVADERQRQDEKWGGAEHDDKHTTAEFVQLIEDYAGWARTMSGMGSAEKAARRMVQVAALALADVERYLRAVDKEREEAETGQSTIPPVADHVDQQIKKLERLTFGGYVLGGS